MTNDKHEYTVNKNKSKYNIKIKNKEKKCVWEKETKNNTKYSTEQCKLYFGNAKVNYDTIIQNIKIYFCKIRAYLDKLA